LKPSKNHIKKIEITFVTGIKIMERAFASTHNFMNIYVPDPEMGAYGKAMNERIESNGQIPKASDSWGS
jgi:hypothetical protein